MRMFKDTYFFFMTLPDRLYPFKSELEGQFVRGRRSYEQAVALQVDKLHRLGYKITLYREVFHFVGSLIFIIVATFVSQSLLGNEMALYVLLAAAIAALSYQEFYLHPKLYGQHPQKGILDWAVWVTPMAAYLFLIK